MTPPNKQPSITDADREAAEKYANVERIGTNGLGQPMYSSESLYDLEVRDIRINAYLAGILHERAKVDELVEAVKEVLKTCRRNTTGPMRVNAVRISQLDKALKQFSGRSG